MVAESKSDHVRVPSHCTKRLFGAVLMLGFALDSDASFCKSLAPAEPVAELQSAATHDKDLGDQYVSEERFSEAADAFQRALSEGREQFTLDERVRMAVYISWENRLETAIDELRRVLSQN